MYKLKAMEVARRVFLGVGLAGSAGWLLALRNAQSEEDKLPRPPIYKTKPEWKKILSLEAYTVTRENDTEQAFTGKYWNFYGPGIYRCVCCATALFDSKAKMAAGTGWPTFSAPISKLDITESPDRSWAMYRTAVSCAQCAAHLGHVFDYGYCINSVALNLT